MPLNSVKLQNSLGAALNLSGKVNFEDLKDPVSIPLREKPGSVKLTTDGTKFEAKNSRHGLSSKVVGNIATPANGKRGEFTPTSAALTIPVLSEVSASIVGDKNGTQLLISTPINLDQSGKNKDFLEVGSDIGVNAIDNVKVTRQFSKTQSLAIKASGTSTKTPSLSVSYAKDALEATASTTPSKGTSRLEVVIRDPNSIASTISASIEVKKNETTFQLFNKIEF